MRILLVEDDSMLADAIARAFTQAAHAVDAVDSGEDADKALMAAEYDLVLLDVALPQIDGLEVRPPSCQALRLTPPCYLYARKLAPRTSYLRATRSFVVPAKLSKK